MTRAARAALLLAVAGGPGCAASRPREPVPTGPGCPGAGIVTAARAICARDETVQTLRARFRADVETPDARRSAEGVLVLRSPDALRVKLFTLAGLTVYDAVLVGDARRVRGIVRQPLAGREQVVDLGADDSLEGAEADLALVLWALWQRRCAVSPEPVPGDASRFRLDARPARSLEREVRVEENVVREEVLVRPAPGAAGAAPERVRARYAGYACGDPEPLPRVIEIASPAKGWRARVTILEQSVNPVLDDALFDVAAAGGTDAGG